MRCRTCQHFAPRGDLSYLGYCRITLPPWLCRKTHSESSVHEDNFCDLHKDDGSKEMTQWKTVPNHATDDTALLRQALDCLTYTAPRHDCIDAATEYERMSEATIAALRERLNLTEGS